MLFVQNSFYISRKNYFEILEILKKVFAFKNEEDRSIFTKKTKVAGQKSQPQRTTGPH